MIGYRKFKPYSRLSKVRGLFPIPFVNRLGERKWTDYFSTFEPQKYGRFDSNACWALSAINGVEWQLEYLWKSSQFTDEAKKFFTDNGYIDINGDFSISERYIEILSGARDEGSNESMFWRTVLKYGLIPRNLLTYSVDEANKWSSQVEFDDDYFKTLAVSQQMKDLGKKFLTYIKIDWEQVGKSWTTPPIDALRTLLLQSPLQIGIPVSQNWNTPVVTYDGSTEVAHEVTLYDIDWDGRYHIYDQYTPNPKILSKDYYLPFVHRGVITSANPPQAIPVSQTTMWSRFWRSLFDYYLPWI